MLGSKLSQGIYTILALVLPIGYTVLMDPVEILVYREGGREPFTDWLRGEPEATRARIDARIIRLRSGKFGKVESVGGGVSELKLDFGPGYRVYFGQIKPGKIVLLLGGGNKSSQQRDIRLAQERWKRYKEGRKS